MKKVDLIFSGYMTAPNGASTFVKKMNGLKEMFMKYDIELRVISQDMFNPKDFSTEYVRKRTSLSQKIFRISKYSIILTRIVLYLIMERHSKSILKHYDKIDNKGEIVAFQEMSACYAFLKKNKNHKQKVYLTLHSNGDLWSMLYLTLPRLKSPFFFHYRRKIEHTLFNGCDMIGFVADLPRKNFYNHYPYDENKTFFVYNGIEVKNRTKTLKLDDKLRLICVGTLCDRKNQMGVLNAISMLPYDYQKDIVITFVGDGEVRNLLEEKSRILKAEVIFTGSTNDVEMYLNKANCFILFSKDEGLPISIIEGMRAGLPIIGSKVAGIPEQIIDGKTGFLVDVNERELAEKLTYIIKHKDLLHAMGKASYEYFLEKFTIDAMVKKYAEIYKS